MPQQSNESSATPKYDDMLPVNIQGCHLLDRHNDHIASFGVTVEIEDRERIARMVNAYDENQATIKDLQERLEKQGKVIKELKSQVEDSNGILEAVKGEAHAMAIGQLKENQFVLNSIPKDLL